MPLILALKGRTSGATTGKLVNTGIDLLPTLLEFAGLEVPKKLPGRSLVPLVLGKPVTGWRDHLVVEDHMAQAGEVDGFAPSMEGRMVRTERFKYCVFSRGRQREYSIPWSGATFSRLLFTRWPRNSGRWCSRRICSMRLSG